LYTGACSCANVNGTPCTPASPTPTPSVTPSTTPTSQCPDPFYPCGVGESCDGTDVCIGGCCQPIE
jgi:hypothetical protein